MDDPLAEHVARRMPAVLTGALLVEGAFVATAIQSGNRVALVDDALFAALLATLAFLSWARRIPTRQANAAYALVGLAALAVNAHSSAPADARFAMLEVGIVPLALAAVLLSWPWFCVTAAGATAAALWFLRFPDASPSFGITIAMIGLGAILHARRLSEIRALARREERFRLLAENASDGIARILLEPRWHYEYVSPGFERLVGIPASELYRDPNTLASRVHAEDRPKLAAQRHAALGSGNLSITFRILRGVDETAWVNMRHARHGDAITIVARDVTETQEAHASLQRAVHLARLMSFAIDVRTGRVAYAPGLLDTLGMDARSAPETADGVLRLFDDASRAKVLAWRESGRKEPLDTELRLRDGRGGWRWIHFHADVERDARGRPLRIVAAGIDVTTQREQAERIASLKADAEQRERLAALGTLVAGVAHEINNPLAFMLGNTELADMTLSDLQADPELPTASRERIDEVRDGLRTVMKGIEDVARITKGLRAVARADAPRREPVSPDSIVDDVVLVATAHLDPHVEVVLDLHAPDALWLDRAQVSQVLTNLILNADDAMTGRSPARLTIRTLVDDDLVHFDVEDTGPGIPQEHQSQVFTPFFTTKSQGTGLGLSVSQRIAADAGGTLTFVTDPGRGTTFRLSLPKVTPSADSARPDAPPRSPFPASAPSASRP